MSFGISMHSTLQAFYNKVKELNAQSQASLFGPVASDDSIQSNILVPTKTYLLDLFQKKFVEAWYDTQEEIERMRVKGAEMLENYYNSRMGAWPMPLATEAGFSLVVEDIVVKGKIDRIDVVDGGLAIVDYKSGKKPAALSETDKQQLYLYQLATSTLPAFKHYGETTSLKYVYLSSEDEYAFLGTTADLSDMRKHIQAVDKAVRGGTFDATPSEETCRNCSYRSSCEFSAYSIDQT